MNIQLLDGGLSKRLSNEAKIILPKAISSSLNNMAFNVMKAARTEAEQSLRLTRPFFKSSIQVEKATPKHLVAEVGILDRVWYAPLLAEGGVRTPRKKYIAVPVNVARGKKGGITKGVRPSVILNKKGYHLLEIGGVKGIWKDQKGGRPILMYVLEEQTHYDHAPYFDLIQIAIDESRNFELLMMENILRGLK